MASWLTRKFSNSPFFVSLTSLGAKEREEGKSHRRKGGTTGTSRAVADWLFVTSFVRGTNSAGVERAIVQLGPLPGSQEHREPPGSDDALRWGGGHTSSPLRK
jgi:hypothetical protein